MRLFNGKLEQENSSEEGMANRDLLEWILLCQFYGMSDGIFGVDTKSSKANEIWVKLFRRNSDINAYKKSNDATEDCSEFVLLDSNSLIPHIKIGVSKNLCEYDTQKCNENSMPVMDKDEESLLGQEDIEKINKLLAFDNLNLNGEDADFLPLDSKDFHRPNKNPVAIQKSEEPSKNRVYLYHNFGTVENYFEKFFEDITHS